MCRLFPCIPIFRGFLLKSVKRMCICDYVKNRIGTCEKCIFRFESELLHWVAPKHTAVFLTFCDYSLPFSDVIKLLYILAFLLPVRSL